MLLADPEADSLRPVTPSPKHPYKIWRPGKESGTIEPFVPQDPSVFQEPFNLGRNALPPAYVQVGAMEVIRTPVVTERGRMAGNRILGLWVENPLWTVNIDTELDFQLAELSLKRLLNGQL